MNETVACCEMMREQLQLHTRCRLHSDDPHGCVDQILWQASDDSIGLLIHDGGSSFVQIAYCPWCATFLPGGEWVDMNRPSAERVDDAEDTDALLQEHPGRRIDLGE